jgi:ferrous iron transport protein A
MIILVKSLFYYNLPVIPVQVECESMNASGLPFFTVPLAELKPGERATFVDFGAGRSLAGRLISLGFTPGAQVEMTQNHGRGPLMVAVRGTFVALGRGEAAKMLVHRSAA